MEHSIFFEITSRSLKCMLRDEKGIIYVHGFSGKLSMQPRPSHDGISPPKFHRKTQNWRAYPHACVNVEKDDSRWIFLSTAFLFKERSVSDKSDQSDIRFCRLCAGGDMFRSRFSTRAQGQTRFQWFYIFVSERELLQSRTLSRSMHWIVHKDVRQNFFDFLWETDMFIEVLGSSLRGIFWMQLRCRHFSVFFLSKSALSRRWNEKETVLDSAGRVRHPMP